MKSYPFKKIDAFATATSSGNPAGLISLRAETDITVSDMQRIARELKGFVSEVGYTWPLPDGTFRLRYFSSEREVEFCGHATIAILCDLIQNDPILIAHPTLTIRTNSSTLEVENRIPGENAVYITSPAPQVRTSPIDKRPLARALQTSPGTLSDYLPVSIVNAGLETLIVPMATLDSVLSLAPSQEELKDYCLSQSVDILTVFSQETSTPAHRFRTRVFAPTFGYLEDPATGSGNAALGHYLLQQGRWDGSPISLEQNGDRANPNLIRLVAKPSPRGTTRVLFGGGAIVRIHGHYVLP